MHKAINIFPDAKVFHFHTARKGLRLSLLAWTTYLDDIKRNNIRHLLRKADIRFPTKGHQGILPLAFLLLNIPDNEYFSKVYFRSSSSRWLLLLAFRASFQSIHTLGNGCISCKRPPPLMHGLAMFLIAKSLKTWGSEDRNAQSSIVEAV